jgi:neutral ceramidase
VRIGDDLLMIVMSGETVVDWSIKFKREFADRARLVWVAGYCNDMYGYVPTRRIQQEGGYEGGRANLWSWVPAPFTDDVENRITDAVRRLVNRVS